jgi:hypothetical protein
MQHADNPAGSRRDHGDVEEMLTRFPGPIYVATGEIINEIGVIESVEYASTDSEPWSVTVRYSRDAAKVAITTSRPAEGLQARGLPVVSVASAAMDLRLWIQDTQSRQASTDRTAASPPPPLRCFRARTSPAAQITRSRSMTNLLRRDASTSPIYPSSSSGGQVRSSAAPRHQA